MSKWCIELKKNVNVSWVNFQEIYSNMHEVVIELSLRCVIITDLPDKKNKIFVPMENIEWMTSEIIKDKIVIQ